MTGFALRVGTFSQPLPLAVMRPFFTHGYEKRKELDYAFHAVNWDMTRTPLGLLK